MRCRRFADSGYRFVLVCICRCCFLLVPLAVGKGFFRCLAVNEVLHVAVHGLCDNLRVGDCLDNGSCAIYDIAGGEDSRAGRVTGVVCDEKTTAVCVKSGRCGDDSVLRSLAD